MAIISRCCLRYQSSKSRSASSPEAGSIAMQVTVRYFAGARAAAGTEQESVPVPPGASVQTLADSLAERHGPGLARVLEVASFLVDEVAGVRSRTLRDGASVDVLPPFAGG